MNKKSKQIKKHSKSKNTTSKASAKDTHEQLLEQIRQKMVQNGVDINRLTNLRQQIHMNPELAFNEHKTSDLIIKTLNKMGLESKFIKRMAGTGIVADLIGTDSKINKKMKIALRADMDALPIQEQGNKPYKSRNSNAHSCGHDGHVAMLLAAAELLIKNRNKMGNKMTIRLIFQPAEEGPGGALPMIKEGVLDGVDEIYGLHNIPNFKEGQIRTKEGAFFGQPTVVRVLVKGRGGHGSAPQKARDPITCGVQIINGFNTIKTRNIDEKKPIVFTICHVSSGDTYNVIPDTMLIEGTIRSYDDQTLSIMKQRIRSIVDGVCQGYECQYDLQFDDYYPVTVNHPLQTQVVIQLAKQQLGQQYFSDDDLPLAAGEDFSYFLQKVPGCFFALGTLKKGQNEYSLHTSDYDFNDDMISYGGHFFTRIIENRLQLDIIV